MIKEGYYWAYETSYPERLIIVHVYHDSFLDGLFYQTIGDEREDFASNLQIVSQIEQPEAV